MRGSFFLLSLWPWAVFAGGDGVDYSAITDAVDFGDMSTVVLTVAGALAGIFVIIKGVRIALSFVRGDGESYEIEDVEYDVEEWVRQTYRRPTPEEDEAYMRWARSPD